MKTFKLILIAFLSTITINAFGSEILFSGETKGQFDIYKTNSDFSHIQKLTNSQSNEIMPTISPDKKKLAFISDRDGANSLYLKYLQISTNTINISLGVGAYANPSFSLDGKNIAVRYAPDPEAPLLATKIVLLNLKEKKQTTIVTSNNKLITNKNASVAVVDHPTWISNNLLAYTIVEYADIDAGTISKSTIYMINVSKKLSARIAGGESYFNAAGKAMGFKATMPSIITNLNGKKVMSFVAIRGAFSRYPMKYSLNAQGKGLINLNDEDFLGPLLFDGENWIYGYTNDDGIAGLAIKRKRLDSKREIMPFKGKVLFPSLFP